MALIAQRFSSARFTWTQQPNNLHYGVAEASDFGHGIGADRVWDDSADVGFVVVSTKTRKELIFTLTEVVRDRNDDITFWEFKTHPESNVIIQVFND